MRLYALWLQRLIKLEIGRMKLRKLEYLIFITEVVQGIGKYIN